MKPGSQILVADGSISLEVLSCDAKAGTVRCKCLNTAMLGWVLRASCASCRAGCLEGGGTMRVSMPGVGTALREVLGSVWGLLHARGVGGAWLWA